MNIVFASGKGGVGKSTLCYLTALALQQAGKSVCVDDRDPQRSITSWVVPDRDNLALVDGRGGAAGEFRLVDTRPALDDESVRLAVKSADLIVMPCTPSPGDLTAARATVELVDRLRRKTARAALVLNKVKAGTVLAQDAPDLLGGLGAPVMSTAVPDRQNIQRAVLLGWDALDAKTQAVLFKLALEILAR